MIFWSLINARAGLNAINRPIQLFQNLYQKWLPQVRNNNSKRQQKDNRYDDREHSFFKLCFAETEKLSYQFSNKPHQKGTSGYLTLNEKQKNEEEDKNNENTENKELTEEFDDDSFSTDKNSLILQHSANSPCEDRATAVKLKSINGRVICVFDGHGGPDIAELAQRKLPLLIDQCLELKKGTFDNEEDYVISALSQAFDLFEEYCLFIEEKKRHLQQIFSTPQRRSSNRHDFIEKKVKPSMIGTCALVVLIYNNKLYSANLGDSKGIIISIDKQCKGQEVRQRKINHKLNANSKKEQARLRSAFPNDIDILVEKHKNNQKVVYVKNILQPTRSFGDFYLKVDQYWNDMIQVSQKRDNCERENPLGLKLRRSVSETQQNQQTFRGPYITHKPDIKIFNLNEQDAYLVMGSDGLWDELNKNEVAEIVQENINENDEEIIKQLLYKTLDHVANKYQLELRDIMFNIQEGERRNLHDDITIILTKLNDNGQTSTEQSIKVNNK